MATTVVVIIILLVLSYLVGSIPPSYLVGRFVHGVDIRKQGSGNVGGANTARLFGKKFGALVGIFDIFKGYGMVLIIQSASLEVASTSPFFNNQQSMMATAGFLVVVGHCYSIFLNFSGGKGGATTAGVVLAIDPLTALILIVFWIIIVTTTRFTSLANLLGVLIIPVMFNFRTSGSEFVTMATALVLLIYYTHRANVSRLLRGEERKFGKKETISTTE